MNTAAPVGRPPKDRLLTLEKVRELVPLSRAGLYAAIQRGSFPRPVKLGRSSLWRLSELEKWMARLQPAKSEEHA